MDRRDIEGSLGPMRDLDNFEVADHEPDPRGWRVMSSDGRQIGDVNDLIVDTNQMKVRYLDCDLDESGLNLSGSDRNRHILVPIEKASFSDADRRVTVQGMNADDVLGMPSYTGGALTAGLASQVTQFFGRSRTPETIEREPLEATRRPIERTEPRRDLDEARVTRAEEEMAVGKRMVESGEVGIHKTVETEHVRRPATRRHDEVDIERRPISGEGRTARIIDEDEEIRIPLREEELVVEKRPEIKEELVVRKRQVEDEVEVEADLLKERIEVERHGQVGEGRGRIVEEEGEDLFDETKRRKS